MKRILSDGKFYKVPLEAIESPYQLINYSHTRGSSYYKVEDCLVNEIVLDKILNPGYERVPPRYIETFKWGPDYVATHCVNPGLKDYQVHDVAKLSGLHGMLNRNGMGLGKTVETVAFMRLLGARTSLIICPKSVMIQWQRSIATFWPEYNGNVYVNSTDRVAEGNIYIYNYERVATNKHLLEDLKGITWDIHVCDEAHRIKNPKSKRTLAMMEINAGRRIALTGTPITNKPNDLFSILKWLNQRYSGRGYWNFTNYFCNIKQDPWGSKVEGLTKDPFRIEVLHELLDKVSVYNPIDVAKGKTRVVVPLEMHKRQAALFKKAKKLLLDELPETMTIANGAVLATRLQQITSYPALFDEDQELGDNRQTFGPGAKFEWIADMVADNEDESFVIFTKFSTTATHLREYLREKLDFLPALYIGDLAPNIRAIQIDAFVSGATRVIIGTIGAMGEGVDGLQRASRTVIFVDRDWTPSTMEQAEDRLNRIGQERPVVCYYLECEKSFDQHVGKVNLLKADDIRTALEGAI